MTDDAQKAAEAIEYIPLSPEVLKALEELRAVQDHYRQLLIEYCGWPKEAFEPTPTAQNQSSAQPDVRDIQREKEKEE
jgi:hypothetical protein